MMTESLAVHRGAVQPLSLPRRPRIVQRGVNDQDAFIMACEWAVPEPMGDLVSIFDLMGMPMGERIRSGLGLMVSWKCFEIRTFSIESYCQGGGKASSLRSMFCVR